MNSYLPILISSAAVGALVSSIITLVGQQIERNARRRELLLSEAVKMAMGHRDYLLKFAQAQNTTVHIPEQAKLAQTYFLALSSLILKSKLPNGMFSNDSPEDQEAFQRKHGN
jgi:hypothetical protein